MPVNRYTWILKRGWVMGVLGFAVWTLLLLAGGLVAVRGKYPSLRPDV